MLPGRQLTLGWLLKTFLRWPWLLIAPAFLGSVGGLLYSRLQPSLYRSDAVVQVVPQRIPDTYVQSTVTTGVGERLSSLAQQVLSRTQMEAVITEFNLYPEERRRLPMEDVFELMTSRVQVVPLESTGAKNSRSTAVDAFRISFDYDNPKTARDVAAKLASFFIDRNATERNSQADQTSAFLEAQMADARSQLEAQEKKLKDFRERNSGRLPTQTQANMQAIQNNQLTLQATVESLARDRDRKLMLERLYNDAAADTSATTAAPVVPAAGPASSAAGATLPADAPLRQRLEAAKAALAQMETRLSAKHPDVVRIKRIVGDLERQVAAEDLQKPLSPDASTTERPISTDDARKRDKLREQRAEIESLDRQIAFKEGEEKRLRAVIGEYQARLEAVPGVESEYVSLTRDYDTLQIAYRALLTKSENSKMAASLEQRQIGEQFRILDQARVPLKPISPNRMKINLIGTVAGLGLGLLLLGLKGYMDTTMRTEADVMGAIELPILALLPYVTTPEDVRKQRRRKYLVTACVAVVSIGTAALAWFLQLWKYVV